MSSRYCVRELEAALDKCQPQLTFVSVPPGKVRVRLTRTKDIEPASLAASVATTFVAIFKNPSKVEWKEIKIDPLAILTLIGPNTIKVVRTPKYPVNPNLDRGYLPDSEQRRILVLTSTDTEWKIELQYLKDDHSEIDAIFEDICLRRRMDSNSMQL